MVRSLEDKTRLGEYTMIVKSKEKSSGKKKGWKSIQNKTKQNCHKERKNQIENLVTLPQASGCVCAGGRLLC